MPNSDPMAQLANEEVFSLMLAAAAIHVGHPGTDNQFQVSTRSELALFYNDTHVLQHYACAQTFQLMSADDVALLQTLSRTQYVRIRRAFIAALLSTDPEETESLVRRMRGRVRDAWMPLDLRMRVFGDSPEAKWRARGGSMRQDYWLNEDGDLVRAVPVTGGDGGSGVGEEEGGGVVFEESSAGDRLLLLSVTLRCADLAWCTKSDKLLRKWSELMMHEFELQVRTHARTHARMHARTHADARACRATGSPTSTSPRRCARRRACRRRRARTRPRCWRSTCGRCTRCSAGTWAWSSWWRPSTATS